jgi:outer membrane scaffolding protein for murein synthesis (MipA/OmpV family)
MTLVPAARRAAALVLTAAFPALALADQPLWELGAGAGTLVVPHYRGSDQRHHWVLPVPYIVYRGEVFRSDREGTRAVLLDTDRVDVDLSVDASPPLASKHSNARFGLPDLPATLEIGPKLNLLLGRGAGWKFDLRLPARAAFTVQSSPRFVGWTFNPELALEGQWQGWNLGVQGGPLAGTARFHSLFYDVAPVYATAMRPAYAARGGYAGWGLTTNATRRFGNWWLAAAWRIDRLDGATFNDSPLVRQRQNISFGLVASCVFATSSTRVPDSR